jgi:hypothetical protein
MYVSNAYFNRDSETKRPAGIPRRKCQGIINKDRENVDCLIQGGSWRACEHDREYSVF